MTVILILILSFACAIKAMPIANLSFVDLTHVFDGPTTFPGGQKIFRIDRVISEISAFGKWYKAELYSQHSHSGTHMDAPSHWKPDGINIDEMPVSQFYGPAAVIDITQRASLNPDAEVTVDDLLEWESGTGQSLNGTIVLIRTGWAEKRSNRAEFLGTDGDDFNEVHYPGISGVACHWLADNRDIKGLGSDTLSPESGRAFFSSQHDCHDAFLPKGVFLLEDVDVKKEVPLSGAYISALPQKIIRGSGAPARVVAFFQESNS